MPDPYVSIHMLGDMVVRLPQDTATGRVGLELIPAALADRAVPRRATLRGLSWIDALPGNDPWPASVVESLVQFKLVGEPYSGGCAQGHTMRNSSSVESFASAGQEVLEETGKSACPVRLRAFPPGNGTWFCRQ